MTIDEVVEALRYKSGWNSRDVPGVELSPQSLFYWDMIDAIKAQTAEIERLLADRDGKTKMWAKYTDSLEEEIERLRAALTDIRDSGRDAGGT